MDAERWLGATGGDITGGEPAKALAHGKDA
jgi:hypothetical protein